MSGLSEMGHGERIIVTGSRDWNDKAVISQALAEQAEIRPLATLVTGACPIGADVIAEDWWTIFGGRIERHPADWRTHGKRAGYLRNAEMVDAGADICLAFITDNSRGASMTAGLAEKAGIETRRFTS